MAWRHEDLTEVTASPSPAGDPFGYVRGEQQHVVFRSGDGNVHELWQSSGQDWHHEDLTSQTSAPPATGDPSGYVRGTQQHVVFRDRRGDVQELSQSTGGEWRHVNLTRLTAAPLMVGDPSGYVRGTQQHVVFRDGDGDVHELWQEKGADWRHVNLTQLTGAPPSIDDPIGYVRGMQQHVVFRSGDGNVHELWQDKGEEWHHENLTQQTGAPPAVSRVAGYVRRLTALGSASYWHNQQHVVFVDAVGDVRELWQNKGAEWRHVNLTVRTGAPPGQGDPSGYVRSDQQHVVFRDAAGRIAELWQNVGERWHLSDLMAKIDGAPPARGNPHGYVRGEQQHIVYRGNDDHIHELWQNRVNDDGFLDALGSLVSGIGGFVADIVHTIGRTVANAVDRLGAMVGSVVREIPLLGRWLAGIVESITDLASTAIRAVADLVSGIVRGVTGVVGGILARDWRKVVDSITIDIVCSIYGSIFLVLGKILSIVQNVIGLESRRPLTWSERRRLSPIFRSSVTYDVVRIVTRNPGAFALWGRAKNGGNLIYMWDTDDDAWMTTLVHEMAHVWQYQNLGVSYSGDALFTNAAMSLGGPDPYEWEAQGSDTEWKHWPPEAQAQFINDVFDQGELVDGLGNGLRVGDGAFFDQDGVTTFGRFDPLGRAFEAWDTITDR